MFSKGDKQFVDFSAELNDVSDWQARSLRILEHHLDVTALAYDPTSGVFAIGNSTGQIHIFGNPGVDIHVEVSNRIRVRLLTFSTGLLFKLLCVDEQDRLHIWDLSSRGKPRLQKIINYTHTVNCLIASPSHSHVFVAFSNGQIETFDLALNQKSPYTVPNLWTLYEDKMRASGLMDCPGRVTVPVEIVAHPRDLNLLFVAYSGGVILSDLTERNTSRVYELVIPPGAPGGVGYTDSRVMESRRPHVTCISVHPSGHLFAVGYSDGSIAFWAVEDEDKPLAVRTLEDEDVNVADVDQLDAALNQPQTKSSRRRRREAIFKLAWSGYPNSSDPRCGETTLTVLGGLRGDEAPGVSVFLLPAFNPPSASQPQDASKAPVLHPVVRDAMRQTVTPSRAYTYDAKGVVQDFLLMPRDNPHYAGAWDPTTIVILSEAEHDMRTLEAYQFPPPTLVSSPEEEPPAKASDDVEKDDIDVLSAEFMSTLAAMKDDPKLVKLPPPLWNGASSVVGGVIAVLNRNSYDSFVADQDYSESLPTRGGVAWVEDPENEMKLTKIQPHRILITHHHDMTIRFQDLSAQLLNSSESAPLECSFPKHLPNLAIDIIALLADPHVCKSTQLQAKELHIDSVTMTAESGECGVVLSNGEVALYRFVGHKAAVAERKVSDDPELVALQCTVDQVGQGFCPLFLIHPQRGAVSSFAMSDIGFHAVGYSDGSLLIVDVRGPKIMYREMPEKREKRHSFLSRSSFEPIESLHWTVTGTKTDPIPRVLLIAIRTSGATTVYSIVRSESGAYVVRENPELTEAQSHPVPGGSVVLQHRSGLRCSANRDGLAVAISQSPPDLERKKGIWVNAGAKGAKCVAEITGERISSVSWPSKIGKVEKVEVVQKDTASVLVAFTDRRIAAVYSIPNLEHMHDLQLEQSSSEPLVVDETGDYIEWIRHPSGLISAGKYGTLFNVRRSGPYATPQVSFENDDRIVPPQPGPVSVEPPSIMSTMMGYISSQGMTGAQLDSLLGGPDRPPVPELAAGARSNALLRPGGPDRQNSIANDGSGKAKDIATSVSNTTSELYNRLGSALAERGEMLGSLQESFDSLEQGSRKMLTQTKNLAAQQTARRWFGF